MASQSPIGSVDELARGFTGRASLELRARDGRGFDPTLYDRVRRVATVRAAAPALVRRVAVVGPRGSRAVALLGGDSRLRRLGGTLVRQPGLLDTPSLSLPESVARPIGVHPGQRVTVAAGDSKMTATVGALLSSEDVAGLARSPIAIAPLRYAQRLADLNERVTHILVEPRPGSVGEARAALERIADSGLEVRSSDSETSLVRPVVRPYQESNLLFSAISAGLGLLFTYNALLLMLPVRRRMCAELRLIGFSRSQVVASLLFETALLAAAGIAVGLALGELLSRILFTEVPRYLANGFAVGDQRIVSGTNVAVAASVGFAAAFGAAARSLRELYGVKPQDAIRRVAASHGERPSSIWPRRLFLLGLALLAGLSALALLAPAAGLIAATLCALVAVAFLPLALKLVVGLASAASAGGRGRARAWIALRELAASPTRSAALAATAAVAVFGITTVDGARRDLVRGVEVVADEFAAAAPIHVRAGPRENYLALEPFAARDALRRIRTLAFVQSVEVHGGALLDTGERRIAIFGRPPRPEQLAIASMLSDGSLPAVASRLRRGGWAAISTQLARERGLSIGERFRLPTPAGEASFRVAATTTTIWPAGSVFMGSRDYRRLWGADFAAELMVQLRSGTPEALAKREIAAALGRRSGLLAFTAGERADEIKATARQGLATLEQIRVLVLICAILAVAAAMGAAVWQRRRRLATLKAIGFTRGQLWTLLGVEGGVLLATGGAIGALVGLYAQSIASRWIERISGIPVSYSPAVGLALTTIALLIVLAAPLLGILGRIASRVSPRAAFSD